MSIRNTEATPVQVALMPDWAAGVRITQQYESTVQRSRTGLEGRKRRRKRARYAMEYQRSGLTKAEAKRRLDAIVEEFRNPLLVPIWPDGIPLQSDMGSASALVLDSSPIDDEWIQTDKIYLWHETAGAEWRTTTSVVGRNITMSGTGILFPAGALAFPVRLMRREANEGMVQAIDLQSGTETLRYRTL